MKKWFQLHTLPYWAMFLGALGFLAQYWLQHTGIDQKGLYITGHFAAIASLLLIPIALALLLLCTWPLNKKNEKIQLPASHLYSLLCALAFGIMVFCGIRALSAMPVGWERICAWAQLLVGLLVGLILVLSLTGKKVSYFLYAGLTLILVLFMVGNYRQWSSEPQLFVYLFPLMATAFSLLASYQRTALAADSGNSRLFCFFATGALFFCLAAIPGSNLFYGGMAFWMLANLWSAKPLGKEKSREAA